MDNTVNIMITLGLQSDEESGDVVGLVLPVTETVYKKIIADQDNDCFKENNEPLSNMIDAYAKLCGYQCGWLVDAKFI